MWLSRSHWVGTTKTENCNYRYSTGWSMLVCSIKVQQGFSGNLEISHIYFSIYFHQPELTSSALPHKRNKYYLPLKVPVDSCVLLNLFFPLPDKGNCYKVWQQYRISLVMKQWPPSPALYFPWGFWISEITSSASEECKRECCEEKASLRLLNCIWKQDRPGDRASVTGCVSRRSVCMFSSTIPETICHLFKGGEDSF